MKMIFNKSVKIVIVKNRIDSDAVHSGTPSDNALYDFEQKKTVHIGIEKLIPFRSVLSLFVTYETEQFERNSHEGCDMPCGIVPDPTLTVPSGVLEVDAKSEFDPLDGVSAKDGNEHNIAVVVTLEGE